YTTLFRSNRPDMLPRTPAPFQHVAEAFIPESVRFRFEAGLTLEPGEWPAGFVEQWFQSHRTVQSRQLGQVEQNFQHSVRLPSHAEWVARSLEALPGGKQPRERIQLVGQGHGGPGAGGLPDLDARRWHIRLDANRPRPAADRLPDLSGAAFCA